MVEKLHDGDMRLGNLYEALKCEILERSTEQQIHLVSVIGILDLLKKDLIDIAQNET